MTKFWMADGDIEREVGALSCVTIVIGPRSGNALPSSVRHTYFTEAEQPFGPDVGARADVLDTLPQEFRSEAWWNGRGL